MTKGITWLLLIILAATAIQAAMTWCRLVSQPAAQLRREDAQKRSAAEAYYQRKSEEWAGDPATRPTTQPEKGAE